MSENEQRRSMDDVLASLRRIMGSGKDAEGHSARPAKNAERDELGGALTLTEEAEALTLTEEIEPLTLTEQAEPLPLTGDVLSDGRESVETGAGTDAADGMSEDLDMIDQVEPVVLDEQSGARAPDTTLDDPFAASGHEDGTTVELDDVEPVELGDDDEALDIDEASLQPSNGEAEESPARLNESDETSADDKASPADTASAGGEGPIEIEAEQESTDETETAIDTAGELPAAPEPAASAELEHPELASDDGETDDASSLDDADAEPAPVADAEERPLTPPDWSEDAATDEAPRVEPAAMTLPAVAGATPELPEDAALEALIRRVIREELLEGEIGQNISRNVQRLIREEVERILARRGL